MKLPVYEFTAREDCDDRTFTFKGYLLPTGEVLCPEAVQAHGNAFVQGYEATGNTVAFSRKELRAAIRGAAAEFGRQAIPRSLLAWLV